MKKKLAVFGIIAGAIAVGVFLARKKESSVTPMEREKLREGKRREMYEKIQEGFEAMPEDFPPVAMFRNMDAIRENSDRILEILEREGVPKDSMVSVAN